MTAVAWALLTAAIWGVVPLLEKMGLGQASPTAGVIVRSCGVMLGAVIFSLLTQPWQALRGLEPKSWLLLMGSGFLASFVGQMAFYRALRTGALSQVTPLAGAYPFITALLGWVLLREPLTFARGAGVLLIVAGIFLLRR